MSARAELLYRFSNDIRSMRRDGNRVTLDVAGWKELPFELPNAAYADIVMSLAPNGGRPGVSYASLVEMAGAANAKTPPEEAINYYVERFTRARLLSWTIADADGELATIEPLADDYRPRRDPLPLDALRLCRFAYLHWLGSGAVLDSAIAPARVAFGARGLASFASSVAQPRQAVEDGFSEALWRLGFFSPAETAESDVRRVWQFHDLVLHEHSRDNREAGTFGGTYRFDGKFPSLPAVKPAMPGGRIGLPAVDAKRIRRQSDSLDAVQARRRSLRAYAAQPISLSSIGEFLWRVCRTTGHYEDPRQDTLSRPYPAGGSINELEFYLAVRRCEGLDPAIYHYDSHGHALVRLPLGTDKLAARIVRNSARAMGLDAVDAQQPDVTVVISSRLPRLAWKYEGMAYRATLMNAGVLFHLMYLVATDMKLAPCANGSGDSRLLQQATGLDPLEEVAIAEFALGVPAADEA